ncbi:citrate lyase acyl carrier protein [Deltaproteobacteria bacterium OttesenSCG-928-M10]|nr:citrate lyase acyl carrier protein [Deltaproteobacteria bacterium OttesenSCG-928-M10]
MTSVLKAAQAGTLESNDIMIIVEPGAGGITLDLESIVKKQFGAAISRTIVEAVKERGITDINIKAIDKGALDYTIQARLATALSRAGLHPNGEVS